MARPRGRVRAYAVGSADTGPWRAGPPADSPAYHPGPGLQLARGAGSDRPGREPPRVRQPMAVRLALGSSGPVALSAGGMAVEGRLVRYLRAAGRVGCGSAARAPAGSVHPSDDREKEREGTPAPPSPRPGARPPPSPPRQIQAGRGGGAITPPAAPRRPPRTRIWGEGEGVLGGGGGGEGGEEEGALGGR